MSSIGSGPTPSDGCSHGRSTRFAVSAEARGAVSARLPVVTTRPGVCRRGAGIVWLSPDIGGISWISRRMNDYGFFAYSEVTAGPAHAYRMAGRGPGRRSHSAGPRRNRSKLHDRIMSNTKAGERTIVTAEVGGSRPPARPSLGAQPRGSRLSRRYRALPARGRSGRGVTNRGLSDVRRGDVRVAGEGGDRACGRMPWAYAWALPPRGRTVALTGWCPDSEADGDATDCEVVVTVFGSGVAANSRRCPSERSHSEWTRTVTPTAGAGRARVRHPAPVMRRPGVLACCRPPVGASLAAGHASGTASQILTAWRCRIDDTSAGHRAARSTSRSAGDHNCLRRCRPSLGVTLGPRSRQYRHPRLQRGAPAPGVAASSHLRAGQARRRGSDHCR